MPTQQEKIELSLRQLCKRLLDIDPECSINKGCPTEYVAFPIISAWREAHKSKEVPEIIRRMIIDGDGRWCEIYEIQHHAKEFLKTHS